eukprot:scaffold30339_cov60-Phaeocystis_antarctica.AAC.3
MKGGITSDGLASDGLARDGVTPTGGLAAACVTSSAGRARLRPWRTTVLSQDMQWRLHWPSSA